MTKTPTQRVVDNLRARGFKVRDRHQWGTQRPATYEARRSSRPAKIPADTVFQHITVTLDTGPLTGDFDRDVRTVERIGYERFQSGVSYNFLVDMTTGMIAVGQPLDAKGTHTVNDKGVSGFSYDQNYWARAIAVLGMENSKLSDDAAEAIAGILAAMMDEGVITKTFDYVPHSHVAYKDCPCDSTRGRMVWIRNRAFAMLKTPSKPTAVKRSRGQKVDIAINKLSKAKGKGKRGERIDKALKTLKRITPFKK